MKTWVCAYLSSLGAEGARGVVVVVEQDALLDLALGVVDFAHPDGVRVDGVVEELADHDALVLERDALAHEAERLLEAGDFIAVVQVAEIAREQLDTHVAAERLIGLDEELDRLGEIGDDLVQLLEIFLGVGEIAELEADASGLEQGALGVGLLGEDAFVDFARVLELAGLLQGVALVEALLVFGDFCVGEVFRGGGLGGAGGVAGRR